MERKIYIGGEMIRTPLGRTAATNFDCMLEHQSGVTLRRGAGWKNTDVYLSEILDLPSYEKYERLLLEVVAGVGEQWDPQLLASDQTLMIISSTKGDLNRNMADPFGEAVARLRVAFSLKHRPLVISNACISGVLAINVAAEMVKANQFRHVVVVGVDVISEFVLYGFQSLYAISDERCQPFDLNRKGVTLGEGGGAVVVSSDKSTFKSRPLRYLAGGDANDANHISGPSRTGEGLVRAVAKAMAKGDVDAEQIGYISAHGTGTAFNDEMEAIAFHRLGLESVFVNSLKAYWGHTLGAAGVIETAACLQTLRRGVALKSLGYALPGTSVPLNVLSEHRPLTNEVILKTVSGFGGGNAALILTT